MMTMLLISTAVLGVPQDTVRIFEDANDAYRRGAFEEAVQGYETLYREHGVNSPAVLYNLGNAYFRSGRLGSAILYYEAALALDPDFSAARTNLAKAVGETRRNLSPPDPRQVSDHPMIRFYPLSPGQSLGLAHGAAFLALLLLGTRPWLGKPRYIWACRLALGLSLVFYGLALAGNHALQSAPRLAVAQRPEAPVFFSTNESEQPRFLLYEGDRVLMDRAEGDWMRLHAHGGERGWTLRDNLGIVDYRVR